MSPFCFIKSDGTVGGDCLKVVAQIAKDHEEENMNDWILIDNPQKDPTTIEL